MSSVWQHVWKLSRSRRLDPSARHSTEFVRSGHSVRSFVRSGYVILCVRSVHTYVCLFDILVCSFGHFLACVRSFTSAAVSYGFLSAMEGKGHKDNLSTKDCNRNSGSEWSSDDEMQTLHCENIRSTSQARWEFRSRIERPRFRHFIQICRRNSVSPWTTIFRRTRRLLSGQGPFSSTDRPR